MTIIDRYKNPTEIPIRVIQEAQAGRWYHLRRVYIVQTDTGVTAIALNALQRFVALLRKLFGSDYFAHLLKSKKAVVLDPATLGKKVSPITSEKPPVKLTGIAATGGMEENPEYLFPHLYSPSIKSDSELFGCRQ